MGSFATKVFISNMWGRIPRGSHDSSECNRSSHEAFDRIGWKSGDMPVVCLLGLQKVEWGIDDHEGQSIICERSIICSLNKSRSIDYMRTMKTMFVYRWDRHETNNDRTLLVGWKPMDTIRFID